MSSESVVPSEKLRQLLRGFPEPAILACARFEATRSPEAFNEAVGRVIQHHLTKPPPADLMELPGETRLAADLGLDSVTMVEIAFLFEDLFAIPVPQAELARIVTLEDLRTALRARLPAA